MVVMALQLQGRVGVYGFSTLASRGCLLLQASGRHALPLAQQRRGFASASFHKVLALSGTDRAPRSSKGRKDGGRFDTSRGGVRGGGPRFKPQHVEIPDSAAAQLEGVAELLATGQKVVVLQGGKARLFYDGNPVVFGGAVQNVLGGPMPADGVFVTDHNGKIIGWGVYNPDSMYRVRLLWLNSVDGECSATRPPGMEDVLVRRLEAATQVRAALRLPCQGTTAYRLLNGEGDRVSGLVADVYGSIVVLSSSARWLEEHKESVLAAFARVLPQLSVVWRQSVDRLRQDGLSVPTRAERIAAGEEFSDEGGSVAESEAGKGGFAEAWLADAEVVEEHGVKFAVAPRLGQKTGHYLDQRDNRNSLARLCKDKSVLDAFCYSGGFGVSAKLAGASAVQCVDSSAQALSLARHNAGLNGVEIETQQADVARFLASARAEGRQWDVVVLDPPKLAPSRKVRLPTDLLPAIGFRLFGGSTVPSDEQLARSYSSAEIRGSPWQDLPRAAVKYKKLNKAALACVAPGGLLLSCTCSAAMAQSGGLIEIIREAAAGGSSQRLACTLSREPEPSHKIP